MSIGNGAPVVTTIHNYPTVQGCKRYSLVRGQKKYELANHLGNVLAVITDRKIQDPTGGYLPCVASYSDYYPFGWEMPGRSSGAAYRYAFNGQEKDGETGFTEFEFRQYDGRVSRFLSLDPIAAQYPWNSPYAFAENRVIDGVDLEGREWRRRTEFDESTGRPVIVLSFHINVYINPNTELTNEEATQIMDQAVAAFSETFYNDECVGVIYRGELTYTFSSERQYNDQSIGVHGFNLDKQVTTILQAKKPNGEKYFEYRQVYGRTAGPHNAQSSTVSAISVYTLDGSNRRNFSEIVRTILHEAGHTGGLEHPWLKKITGLHQLKVLEDMSLDLIQKIKNNLMNSEQNPQEELKSRTGTKLEREQLEYIDSMIQAPPPARDLGDPEPASDKD